MASRIANRFVSDRVQVFPESVIRSMSRVAARHGAVNLGQGFPDFDPPRAVMDAAKQAIDAGHNQYAVTWGVPELRQAICRKLGAFNGIEATSDDNVVVTCGATEAMMASLLATVNPGDKVVIFEPYYENFGPDAVLSGATPIWVPLVAPDYQPDPAALEAAFARKPKAVIVNTPGNPTGRIFTLSTLEHLAELCVRHDVLAITDEIYEHMVYDGQRHTSLATLPGMAQRTVTIGGFSKTYSVTGWRLAYTVAPKEVTDGIKRVHDFLTVGAAHPLQVAAVTALGLPESYYTHLRDSYQAKRDLMLAALSGAGFRCHKPDSAYYILADWTPVVGDLAFREGSPFADDTAFALWLTAEVGVACIPGSSFFADKAKGRHLVRVAYPKQEATLREAARRLATARTKAAALAVPA